MKQVIITLFYLLPISVFAQNKELDKSAIKEMCGCYEVSFNFSEVYSPDLGYDLKKPYHSKATELITVINEDDDFISLQHILQVSDEMIIKHWRQDWQYEDNLLLQYDVASTWKEKSVDDATGKWTQSVYQVDDSPRYEGIGVWTHTEDNSYWEGSSDSPLPRRDLTTRDDYNVLNRRNRHTIVKNGHLHEEDNTKIYRSNQYGDEIIAIEKGYNLYTKVDDEKCAIAKQWWDDNQKFWEVVRKEWESTLSDKTTLSLDFENGKNSEFYMAMFQLGEEFAGDNFNKRKAKKAVKELVKTFTIDE